MQAGFFEPPRTRLLGLPTLAATKEPVRDQAFSSGLSFAALLVTNISVTLMFIGRLF